MLGAQGLSAWTLLCDGSKVRTRILEEVLFTPHRRAVLRELGSAEGQDNIPKFPHKKHADNDGVES